MFLDIGVGLKYEFSRMKPIEDIPIGNVRVVDMNDFLNQGDAAPDIAEEYLNRGRTRGPEYDEYLKKTTLMVALNEWHNLAAFEMLLKAGSDPNVVLLGKDYDSPPLIVILHRKFPNHRPHLEVQSRYIRLLLKHGSDVTCRDGMKNSCLQIAVARSFPVDIVEEFVKLGLDPDATESSWPSAAQMDKTRSEQRNLPVEYACLHKKEESKEEKKDGDNSNIDN